ncbi:hypothetical protein HC928_18310 [bacterium]|nr:hypothetical protein [bacterium]
MVTLVRCGRRFGKTSLAIYQIITECLSPNRKIAYFAPTYKMIMEVWRDLKHRLAEVIHEKNETTKRIVLVNGSIIDFWSLLNADSIRGTEYHWQLSMRPLLFPS